ncbi:hypothetical protein BDF20DRAFT_814337 [Mycotypha africana]|uniref:uncharacterized protein n=1 Tax=Mycotypha africana TaxID=64632 RepID=UPI0023016614|nr:uncharacterized protein BDF20DRAFT_814337 [Mycotypha africana]KAI8988319.1 hypothetical protein BDF20DRAFT_814337 [Mycotypha africana]
MTLLQFKIKAVAAAAAVVSKSPFQLNWVTISLTVVLLLILYRPFGGFYYRSLMALVCLTIMAIYGTIVSIIFPLFGQKGMINYTVAHGYYMVGTFFCGIKVKSEGEENLYKHKGPVIYVCNHQSSMDIMLMGKVYPKNTAIVAKKQLKYYPFLGWFMILSNAIFLDRKNRKSAVAQARQAALDIHKKNVKCISITSVWIFPEGTRGHAEEISLLPFKKGAFFMAVQAGVPVVPVVIANYNEAYNAKKKRFLPKTIRCKVLPPISTEGVAEDSAEIEKLTNKCRDQMLEALQEITPAYDQKKAQ